MHSDIGVSTQQVVGASFGLFSNHEIRKISVVKIDNEVSINRLMVPIRGGLYDPLMGPMDRDISCYVQILQHLNAKNMDNVFVLLDQLNNYDKKSATNSINLEQNLHEYTPMHSRKVSQDNDVSHESMLRLAQSKNMIGLYNAIVRRFMQEQPVLTCDNCGALKLTITKEDNVRILVQRRSKKQMEAMWKKGVRYRSVLYFGDDQSEAMQTNNPNDPYRFHLNSSKMIPYNSTDPVIDWYFYRNQPDDGLKSQDDTESFTGNQRIMFPNEIQLFLQHLWRKEHDLAELIWSSLQLTKKTSDAISRCQKMRSSSSDLFFVQVIPVPPNRFRPMNVVGSIVREHAQNFLFKRFITLNKKLQSITSNFDTKKSISLTKASSMKKSKDVSTATGQESLEIQQSQVWLDMQLAYNDLADSNMSNVQKWQAKPLGIKQVIEKKEGLLRQNMMGKRVDYAARSVISPDPYIATVEIGVPLLFAKSLSYPEPVTNYNINILREMVINGPKVHPGANAVEDQDGNIVSLKCSHSRRVGIANLLLKPSLSVLQAQGNLDQNTNNFKRVYRHLVDGDLLIVNRQPTLHKPSMMVHKARVLGTENTIQMHYSNCNTYNADFDGDEMNLHLVQNEMARAEALIIAINDNQYIVPKDGSPIRGLIQDHVISGVILTQRNTFLSRELFQQLYYTSCWDICPSRQFRLRPPAILKPKPFWTGKQLISTILDTLLCNYKPLNLENKSIIPDDMWGHDSNEGTVIIRENHLVCGSLGKNQFGAKPHGLIHAVYELYSPEVAGKLLTILGRLFTSWLQHFGFTCGIDDALLTPETEKERFALRQASDRSGIFQAGAFLDILTAEQAEDPNFHLKKQQEEYINRMMHSVLENPVQYDQWDKYMIGQVSRTTSLVIDKCLPRGQVKPFPMNNLSLMTVSGAKGSRVNFSQISCLLGQQELEGKRVPMMATHRSLPSFLPYDPSPRAGGYILDRFLTGIRPVEYFFHCMAGREGLIDTAVKTSRSGYLQRCLIKHLESAVVQYDYTVRDATDGSIIQFHYGEDSIDVVKCGFLRNFQFFYENFDSLLDNFNLVEIFQKLSCVPKKSIKHTAKVLARLQKMSAKQDAKVDKQIRGGANYLNVIKPRKPLSIDVPDPILSQYCSGSTIGAVSEQFQRELDQFIENHPTLFSKESYTFDYLLKDDAMLTGQMQRQDLPNNFSSSRSLVSRDVLGHKKIHPDMFRIAMHIKYLQSLVQPGEVVGVLAGQSVGEPSTQMTLNTFHLAGKSEVNVTLGIPRLRELIQTCGTIKTPTMILPLRPCKTRADAERLVKQFYRLTLNELIDSVEVCEELISKDNVQNRVYSVQINLNEAACNEWKIPDVILASKIKAFIITVIHHIDNLLKHRVRRFNKSVTSIQLDALDMFVDENSPVEQDPNQAKSKKSKLISDEDGMDAERNSLRRRETTNYELDEEDLDIINREDQEQEDVWAEDEVQNQGAEIGDPLIDEQDGNMQHNMKTDEAASDLEQCMDSFDEDGSLSLSKSDAIKYSPASGMSKSKQENIDSIHLEKHMINLEAHRFDFRLVYPANTEKILLLSMIEHISENYVVRQVGNITKAAVLKNDTPGEPYKVQTAGLNFENVHRLSNLIDIDRISTNDVRSILHVYGIEAAREALRSEVATVFQAYGISVNYRHLSFISDYMTQSGSIQAMTRSAIACNSSPFLRMTFESTTKFLAKSVISGDFDNSKSPSAALILGLVPHIGTGLCEMRYKVRESY